MSHCRYTREQNETLLPVRNVACNQFHCFRQIAHHSRWNADDGDFSNKHGPVSHRKPAERVNKRISTIPSLWRPHQTLNACCLLKKSLSRALIYDPQTLAEASWSFFDPSGFWMQLCIFEKFYNYMCKKTYTFSWSVYSNRAGYVICIKNHVIYQSSCRSKSIWLL